MTNDGDGDDGPVVRLIFPHQLFEEHLDAPRGTVFVLVEDDLMMRQFRFHSHKLVLHRASMRGFADRLKALGHSVHYLASDARRPTGPRLTALIEHERPARVQLYDPMDDWLNRDTTASLAAAGYRLRPEDILESPGFLTTRADVTAWFHANPTRMQQFYTWQRRRLDVLLDGGKPVGGRWSYDTENRRKLPRGHLAPAVPWAGEPNPDVRRAVTEIADEFPDAPGSPRTFAWPTTHAQARVHLDTFLAQRLALFGPYEDAISSGQPHLYHSLLTPMLNTGLLTPREVLDATLAYAADAPVPIASLEGFVRQLIGWREYMRGTYLVAGRRLRTSNVLGHTRTLDMTWWDATTGLAPVDHVIVRVLERGYAHHIERLMVLGNAMCLLRIDPTDVYEWFMALFIDAYDWVMVPNVYGMSQFAAGESMTTKPYVSGSNYLRKMSDLPTGDWTADWDALYWTFVHDHREVFERNHRARSVTRLWDGFDVERRQAHVRRAAALLR